MFRPRDSHDLRHLSSNLTLSPAAEVRWYHDVFNNSIAVADFSAPADTLVLESEVVIEHYGSDDIRFPIKPYAQALPFSYAYDDIADLARTNERHYPDPDQRIDQWARAYLAAGNHRTDQVLGEMTRGINADFAYEARYEEGTKTPDETLRSKSGTCRDFALLMIEAARALGLAARFVTGYLYDPSQDSALELRGANATHAWVQVFLPGAGWVEYDPTNGLIGGTNLIRVAVTRDPSQAMVVQGTYLGAREDFAGMEVSVDVKRLD
jgi:transglutaminase-like putative cysteine protease